jgi:hypothetical protein
VKTDDAVSTPTQLVLEVKILQYAAVEPRMIYWKMGGDDSEQRILCTAQTDHRINLTAVTCSLPDVVATIDTLEPGRSYAVRLRSSTHMVHATALIRLHVDIAGIGPLEIDTYAYYR